MKPNILVNVLLFVFLWTNQVLPFVPIDGVASRFKRRAVSNKRSQHVSCNSRAIRTKNDRVVAIWGTTHEDDPVNRDDRVVFVVGEGKNDDLPEGLMEEIESAKPSELQVLKELLGINIFTYILAFAIAFFMGMNTFLGPGWLGSSIGIKGTGSSVFDETPGQVVDLSDPKYQVKE